MEFILKIAVTVLAKIDYKLNYTYYILKCRMIACIPRRLFCSWSHRSTRMFRPTQTREQSSKNSSLRFLVIEHASRTDLQIWSRTLIIVFNLVHAEHMILYYLSGGFVAQQEDIRRCRKPWFISNFVPNLD